MKKYWMVWNKDKGRPRVEHASLEIALGEARRLSEGNPYCKFVVFEVVHEIEPTLEKPPEELKEERPKSKPIRQKRPTSIADIRRQMKQ